MRIAAILLAAGSSRRFGGEKLLAPWKGRPLWEHPMAALAESAPVSEVIVVVRPGFPTTVDPALDAPPPRLRFIVNPDHEEGMASSLRAGVAAAPVDADAYLVALADMPGVSSKLVDALIAFFETAGKSIVVPVCGGRRGHPVIFGAALRERLLNIRADVGAREILRESPELVGHLETDDRAILFDVDTRADLAAEAQRVGAPLKILVKGAGEQASGVAHRLFRCGFRVAMTELEHPTAIRRTVSFGAALYDGEIAIEGVRGVGRRLDELGAMGGGPAGDAVRAPDGPPAPADPLPGNPPSDHIPVFVDPRSFLVALWRPDVIVDARIMKTNLDNRPGDAALVIGLGPGLAAGRDVHYVVETNRGHHLGRIIKSGTTEQDTGEPGDIGGYRRERLLRSPADGVFESSHRIGELVAAGEPVGRVAGGNVTARIAGVLRGLAWPGLVVTAGQKLADIDPRGDRNLCFTISDKARTISGSVLEIIVAWMQRSGHQGD